MNSAVITVIGGGSVNWMRGLMKDIYMIDDLGGGEIRLVDPNREHVQAVADMLNTFNRMRDKTYKISVMEDLDEALSAADIAVETLGSVSRAGLRPKPSGELPSSVASICRLHADVHELTVKAALSGSRDLLIEALSLDPLSAGADFSELPALTDELLEANREWLPRFYNERVCTVFTSWLQVR